MSYNGTEFYSTPFAVKVGALAAMVGDRVTVNGLADILADIADGAGGGEYLSYGNEGGGRDYVSPMCDDGHSRGGRTWYAFLSVTEGVIVRTSYGSAPSERSSDDVRTLADMMAMFQDDAREAADGAEASAIEAAADWINEPRAMAAAEVAEAAAGDPLLDLVTAAAEAEAAGLVIGDVVRVVATGQLGTIEDTYEGHEADALGDGARYFVSFRIGRHGATAWHNAAALQKVPQNGE